jgi:hypothetical protein
MVTALHLLHACCRNDTVHVACPHDSGRVQAAFVATSARLVHSVQHFTSHQGTDGCTHPGQPAWMVQLCQALRSLGTDIISSLMVRWAASHAEQVQHAGAQAAVLELAVIYALAWSLRSMHSMLSTVEEEGKLEQTVLSALSAGGFEQLPEQGELWESSVDAVNVCWTSWSHVSILKPLLPLPEAPDVAHPRQAPATFLLPTTSIIAQHTLAGHVLASGHHALLLGAQQHELASLQHALRASEPAAMRGVPMQRLQVTCTAAATPSQLQVRTAICLAHKNG